VKKRSAREWKRGEEQKGGKEKRTYERTKYIWKASTLKRTIKEKGPNAKVKKTQKKGGKNIVYYSLVLTLRRMAFVLWFAIGLRKVGEASGKR